MKIDFLSFSIAIRQISIITPQAAKWGKGMTVKLKKKEEVQVAPKKLFEKPLGHSFKQEPLYSRRGELQTRHFV
jgi:hypothetical protein